MAVFGIESKVLTTGQNPPPCIFVMLHGIVTADRGRMDDSCYCLAQVRSNVRWNRGTCLGSRHPSSIWGSHCFPYINLTCFPSSSLFALLAFATVQPTRPEILLLATIEQYCPRSFSLPNHPQHSTPCISLPSSSPSSPWPSRSLILKPAQRTPSMRKCFPFFPISLQSPQPWN